MHGADVSQNDVMHKVDPVCSVGVYYCEVGVGEGGGVIGLRSYCMCHCFSCSLYCCVCSSPKCKAHRSIVGTTVTFPKMFFFTRLMLYVLKGYGVILSSRWWWGCLLWTEISAALLCLCVLAVRPLCDVGVYDHRTRAWCPCSASSLRFLSCRDFGPQPGLRRKHENAK